MGISKEVADRLIVEAKATRVLNLRGRGLRQLPEWALELKDLIEIDVSDNRLRSPISFAWARRATILKLGSNQLSSLQGVSFPPGLAELYLGGNQLTGLEGVSLPLGLTKLHLLSNQLTNLDDVSLPPGLCLLDLGNNQLTSLKGISLPLKLTALYLGWNGLTSLEGVTFPRGLTDLDLGCNQLTSLDGVSLPLDLTSLSLGCNQLRSLNDILLPPGLTKLHLNENQLATLDGIEKLECLEVLDIRNNPRLGIANELAERIWDPEAILAWERAAHKGAGFPAVKVAILGEAEVGKTALRSALCEDARDDDSKRTSAWEWSRLELKDVQSQVDGSVLPVADVSCDVFDFGGQRRLTSAHRFFLANRRTIYLIVADRTRSQQENRLRYWLAFVRHVHDQAIRRDAENRIQEEDAFGRWTDKQTREKRDEIFAEMTDRRSCPQIVIVVTKCAKQDESPVGRGRLLKCHPDMSDDNVEKLAADYEAEVVLNYDSYSKDQGISNHGHVREALAMAAAKTPDIWHERFPRSFPAMVETFQKRFGFSSAGDDHSVIGETDLSETEALALIEEECRGQAFDQAVKPQHYLSVMRDLGVVHWLGDWPGVKDLAVKRQVFNPRWVRGPVYDVLWYGRIDRDPNDLIEREDALLRVLQGYCRQGQEFRSGNDRPALTRDQAALMLRLMEACDLVFQIEPQRATGLRWYLIPDWMSDESPFERREAVAWWDLGFIDDSLIPQLLGWLWNMRHPDVKLTRTSFGIDIGNGQFTRLVTIPGKGRMELEDNPSANRARLEEAIAVISTILHAIPERRGAVVRPLQSLLGPPSLAKSSLIFDDRDAKAIEQIVKFIGHAQIPESRAWMRDVFKRSRGMPDGQMMHYRLVQLLWHIMKDTVSGPITIVDVGTMFRRNRAELVEPLWWLLVEHEPEYRATLEDARMLIKAREQSKKDSHQRTDGNACNRDTDALKHPDEPGLRSERPEWVKVGAWSDIKKSYLKGLRRLPDSGAGEVDGPLLD